MKNIIITCLTIITLSGCSNQLDTQNNKDEQVDNYLKKAQSAKIELQNKLNEKK